LPRERVEKLDVIVYRRCTFRGLGRHRAANRR
jgi:hypothetical protein